MNSNHNLEVIYEILNDIKFNLFCKDDCFNEEEVIVKSVIDELLEENFCKEKEDNCDKSKCINLITLLIKTISKIEECTCCKKNYGYLLQIDRFECILDNLKGLFCQLRCLKIRECDLVSKVLCILFKIIKLIADIISKINNIECLCKSKLHCECELLECMICDLAEEVEELEKQVSELACLVLEIASKNIINCTTSRMCIYKKRDYLKDYCDHYYIKSNSNCQQK